MQIEERSLSLRRLLALSLCAEPHPTTPSRQPRPENVFLFFSMALVKLSVTYLISSLDRDVKRK